MTHEDIVERAAESIMQRVNDTWPRTLNKDVLRDEIGKAIREASKRQNWPPALALGDLVRAFPLADTVFIDNYLAGVNPTDAPAAMGDPVTTSHDRMRAKLSSRLSDYKPE